MKVLLLGATGTIGASTAQALHKQGHDVTCVLRARPAAGGQHDAPAVPPPFTQIFADPCDPNTWGETLRQGAPFDAVISCLASRTGTPRDAWRVDYQAHIDILNAVQQADIKHFVLLSAMCVQKPILAFQEAKLRFENALIASGMTYSIVRPTAFFKSLSGQLMRVKNGKSFLVFGDGLLTACKPISDRDLADYLVGCLTDVSRHQKILPIGGPGAAITPLAQGEALFQALGKPARFSHVPVRLLDVIIRVLSVLGRFLPAAADKAELAKIGRYYATESMLVWDPQTNQYSAEATPSHGRDHLFDAYTDWAHGEAAPARREHAVF